MKKIIILLITIITFTSCNFGVDPDDFHQKKEIVSNKAETLSAGTTQYQVAYESGESDKVSFGIYHKYDKGDTLYFYKNDEDVFIRWQLIDKDIYYQMTDTLKLIREKRK